MTAARGPRLVADDDAPAVLDAQVALLAEQLHEAYQQGWDAALRRIEELANADRATGARYIAITRHAGGGEG